MAESSSAPRRTGYRLPPFAELIGIEVVEAGPERVVGRIQIGPQHSNGRDQAHGGAIMSLADTLGAIGTVLNLPKGAVTTTIESKTNFLAAGRSGVVRAEATPLHRGRRTQVWQTRITDQAGRLLSQTVQTQLVLE